MQLRVGDEWYEYEKLPHSQLRYHILPDRIEIYIPEDCSLPFVGKVQNLRSWLIEAYLMLPRSQGDCYFQLVDCVTYDQLQE